ncbi:hypothetical protein [Desulfospira joergensenii]|uniref:hypothetical protein n=1 Tax=Desulfospira joergensenii TaxID=53329 RepID=UPI0003B49B99|nr:hypothetical protein [Desulfospira joergensenii]
MNENTAQQLFQDYRRVWTREYVTNEMPNQLTFLPGGQLDGGAAPNFVYLTHGALQCSNSVTSFAIAHEMSHVVTLQWLQRHGLVKPPVAGKYDYFWGEYVADLIAFHLIYTFFRVKAHVIKIEFPSLAHELGTADNTHPDGGKRVNMLQSYSEQVTSGENPWNAMLSIGRSLCTTGFFSNQ